MRRDVLLSTIFCEIQDIRSSYEYDAGLMFMK